MAYIELSSESVGNIKVLIFTEGTILKPKSILHLFSFKNYVPIGNCISKIQNWKDNGAEIVYCTSRKGEKNARIIADILERYNFTGTKLYYRVGKQKYKDIVQMIKPDYLIEDDCKSIGGSWQMCITYVEPELKQKIASVVVKEYKGIDYLPEQITSLDS